jgi:hypothetical protein
MKKVAKSLPICGSGIEGERKGKVRILEKNLLGGRFLLRGDQSIWRTFIERFGGFLQIFTIFSSFFHYFPPKTVKKTINYMDFNA